MDNQKIINGRKYSFGYLPVDEALKVEIAIAKVIGEPLFKAATGDENDPDGASAIAVALGIMFSKIDADELISLMKKVFEFVSCDGQRVDMNSTFSGGHIKDMHQVFIAALRYNFADFFDGSLFPSLAPKLTARLNS
jgi:hypothetical protein